MGGSLVAGILLGDAALIGRSLDSDLIVEPVRGPLIPGFQAVKEAARAAGGWALVCDVLSGLGQAPCRQQASCSALPMPRLTSRQPCVSTPPHATPMPAGAYGCTISGAGPTAVAIVSDPEVGERVKAAMVAAFKSAGKLEVNSAAIVRLDNEGARRVLAGCAAICAQQQLYSTAPKFSGSLLRICY